MKVLALETSAKSVSAAVTEDGAVLCRAFSRTGLTHSRTLLPTVEAMLKNAELRPADMDAFAAAAGPGSFTGLRIGVSAVKGLGWALDKPCVGVSTLEAMARNAQHTSSLLICAMDARRGQVYNAIFRARGTGAPERLCPDRAIGLEELAGELERLFPGETALVLGDGAQLCFDFLSRRGLPCHMAPETLRWQDAVGVALCAEDAIRRGEGGSAQDLGINYQRASQAERLRACRQGSTSLSILN